MRSIKRQLLAALLAATTLALSAGAWLTYRDTLDEVSNLFDYQLRQMALSLGDPATQGMQDLVNLPEGFDFVIQISGPKGVRVFYSNTHKNLPGLVRTENDPSQTLDTTGVFFTTLVPEEGVWRVFAKRWQSQTIVQVGQPLKIRQKWAWDVAMQLTWRLIALLPLLSALIWILVRRGLAPLDRLAQALGQRNPRAMEALPEGHVPQEVLPLVQALNALLLRLTEALNAQRAFIADAAHELRTPVAAMRLQAQLLERTRSETEAQAALQDLKAGIRRAGDTVDQLLTLACQEPEMADKPFAKVRLSDLAQQVIGDQFVLANDKAIDLGLADDDQEAVVWGEAEGLRILLANLLGNALRYTPEGGRVDVHVRMERQTPVLEVTDTGPGIPEMYQGRVFDRLFRCPETTEAGTGLGLAIVKTVAERHGAKVELQNVDGGGLRVKVLFPALATGDRP